MQNKVKILIPSQAKYMLLHMNTRCKLVHQFPLIQYVSIEIGGKSATARKIDKSTIKTIISNEIKFSYN
jgi:hypothetical protein